MSGGDDPKKRDSALPADSEDDWLAAIDEWGTSLGDIIENDTAKSATAPTEPVAPAPEAPKPQVFYKPEPVVDPLVDPDQTRVAALTAEQRAMLKSPTFPQELIPTKITGPGPRLEESRGDGLGEPTVKTTAPQLDGEPTVKTPAAPIRPKSSPGRPFPPPPPARPSTSPGRSALRPPAPGTPRPAPPAPRSAPPRPRTAPTMPQRPAPAPPAPARPKFLAEPPVTVPGTGPLGKRPSAPPREPPSEPVTVAPRSVPHLPAADTDPELFGEGVLVPNDTVESRAAPDDDDLEVRVEMATVDDELRAALDAEEEAGTGIWESEIPGAPPSGYDAEEIFVDEAGMAAPSGVPRHEASFDALPERPHEYWTARAQLLEAQLPHAASDEAAARILLEAARIHELKLAAPQRAVSAYAQARARAPAWLAPILGLIRIAEDAGRWEEVDGLLEEALGLDLSGDERIEILLLRAEIALSVRRDEDRARAILAQAARVSAKDPEVLLALGEVAFARGDLDAVVDCLRPLADAPGPAAAGHALLEGARSERSADPVVALDRYKAAAAADPKLVGVHLAIERTALGADDRVAAREARLKLAHALEGAPEAAAWQYRAARLTHLIEGRALDAVTLLSALPPTPARQNALLAAADSANAVDTAVQAATALAADRSGTAAAIPLVTAGLLLRRNGRLEEALELLARAATEAPDLGPAVWAEEELLRASGQVQRAAERYAIFGEDAAAAAIFEQAGMSADAIPLLDRLSGDPAARALAEALEVDRADWARVSLRRAESIARGGAASSMAARLGALASSQAGRLGDIRGAIETLQRVRELTPDDPLTETWPLTMIADDDAARARAARQEASRVADEGRAADALVREGWAQEALGDRDAATRVFEEALARRPGHPFAATALARLRWSSGDGAGAAALARAHATTAGPSGAFDLILAARAAWDVDPAMATSDLQAAITAQGKAAEVALRRLAGWIAPQGTARAEILEATALATPAADPTPATAAFVQAAEAWEDAGEPTRAVAMWRRAEALAPAEPAIVAGLRRALERAGDLAALGQSGRADLQSEDPVRRARSIEHQLDVDGRVRGDAAAASKWLSQLMESRPDDLWALRAGLRDNLKAGREDDAALAYARIARILEGHADAAPFCRRAAHLMDRAKDAAPFGSLELAVIAAEVTPDPWGLRYLEANARLDRDAHALAAVVSRLADAVGTGPERAAYRIREAEACREGGRKDAAVAAYRKAVEAAPEHLVALRGLARLARDAGDAATAAAALDDLARYSSVPAHVAQFATEAGVLWQDVAHDDKRALDSFARVLDADATYQDAFDRVMKILEGAGRHADAALACQKRIAAGGPPEAVAALWRSVADHRLAASERIPAKEALREALRTRPDDTEALRQLVDLLVEDLAWNEAVERLVALGELVSERDEVRAVFFRLGQLLEERIKDPKRAEESYRRVLAVDPSHVPSLQRLSHVLVEQANWPAARDVTTQLLAAVDDPAQRRPWRVLLARIHEEGFQDARAAEAQLEEARREAPTDLEAVTLLADFYRSHGAGPALAIHLDRAATDLRRVLTASPFDEAAYRGLAQVLQWRGKSEGARAVGELLAMLGQPGGEERAGGEPLRPGAADPGLDEILVPSALPPALRELLKLTHETFDKALGADAKSYGVGRSDRMPSKGHPTRETATALARAFGFHDVDVYLSQRDASALLVLPGSTPSLIIGRDLFGATSEAERAFLIARSLKLVQGHLAVPLLWPTEELGLWLGAVVKQFDSSFTGSGLDPGALDERTARLAKLLPRKVRDPLMPFALECEGAKALDPAAIQAGATELADRTALLVCGSISAAVGALRKIGGDYRKPSSRSELIARAEAVPAVRRLLGFAISDPYFEARTRAAQAAT